MKTSAPGGHVGPRLRDRVVDLLDLALVDVSDVGEEVGDVALGVLGARGVSKLKHQQR